MLAQVFQSPVASQQMMIKFAQLSICPASDKDTYKVDITTNLQNLTALVEYAADGMPLQAAVLNAGGSPIATSTPVSGMADMVQAMAANLPPGTVYVQVSAPT